MKIGIFTDGFFFPCKPADRFMFLSTNDSNSSKGMVYRTESVLFTFYEAVYVGGHICVPPQSGEYEGEVENLSDIYRTDFNITSTTWFEIVDNRSEHGIRDCTEEDFLLFLVREGKIKSVLDFHKTHDRSKYLGIILKAILMKTPGGSEPETLDKNTIKSIHLKLLATMNEFKRGK